MRTLGNVIWFVFGGVFMGLTWWFIGLIAFISIVGIPWGKACFTIGQFSFFPFGNQAINRAEIKPDGDIGTGIFGTVGNIIWFVLAGIWLAIGHFTLALICFVTIIGIPFGIQHVKLAIIALMPIGQTVVSNEVADALRSGNSS
ncbi:YccF domain-containing protein [Granulosicoccus sp.]|nr:YccF domain-containing protein [Granulosicoccus sp.]MDB4223270.1 YccF domain-containing protein [Granulosicoccus sp.]